MIKKDQSKLNMQRHAITHFEEDFEALYSKYFSEQNKCLVCKKGKFIQNRDRNNHLALRHDFYKDEIRETTIVAYANLLYRLTHIL